ncbi:MAG: hypothetical protein ACKVHU_09725 [Acidimicrobiales bacterium]
MKKLWIHHDIDAPGESLWDLLTDLQQWPGCVVSRQARAVGGVDDECLDSPDEHWSIFEHVP